MYTGNKTKDLLLTIDKVNVLDYNSQSDKITAKITLSAHKSKSSVQEYLARRADSMYLYVYMVTEEQSSKIVSGLSEEHRKDTINKMKLLVLKILKNNNMGRPKVSVQELLSRKKIPKNDSSRDQYESCSFQVEISKSLDKNVNPQDICLSFFETSEQNFLLQPLLVLFTKSC